MKLSPRSLALLAALPLHVLASAALAQTRPCASANDTNTIVSTAVTAFGFAGPNRNAWRFTPTTSLALRGMRLFTAHTASFHYMTLELWDDDSATMLPKSRLARTSWYSPKASSASWQGGNFDQLTVLTPNKSYWLVWIDPGFSTVPEEPNGATTFAKARWTSSGWAAAAAPGALKFRLYCSLLDGRAVGGTSGIALRGDACRSASGGIGTAFTNELPTLGNAAYGLEGSGFPSAAPAVLILGANPQFQSLPFGNAAPGCSLHTDIALVIAAATGAGDTRAQPSTGIASHVRFALPIPSSPSLRGAFLGAQIAVLDSASPNSLPFAFSNGLTSTVQ